MSNKRLHPQIKRERDHRLRWRKQGPHTVRKIVKTTMGRSSTP